MAMSWFCRLPQWVDWFPEKNPWEKSHGSHGFRCSDFSKARQAKERRAQEEEAMKVPA